MREREVTDLVYEEPPTPAPKDDPQGLWVPRDYMMNPDLEEIVLGKRLQDGMLVLVEPTSMRTDLRALNSARDDDEIPSEIPSGFSFFLPPTKSEVIEYLNRQNRWCIVEDLEVTEEDISFVGVYYDGTMASRYYPKMMPWLVRRMDNAWRRGYTPKHKV